MTMPPTAAIVLLLVLLNVATWATYRWDKRLARRDRRRMPEGTLLALAWLGGWAGALVAVYGHRQRHKAQKWGFVALLWLGVVAWVVGVAWFVQQRA